jgi:Flp pilus assembly protein TadG
MRGRRGSSLIEFTLVGIPVIFVTASIVNASIAMWQFSNMAYAIQVTDSYVVLHGRGCTEHGNTCSLTVGTVASMIATQAPSLDTSKLKVTLQTNSASVVCEPLSNCLSNTTQFPSSTDNAVNFDVKIVATYPFTSPVAMFWPGAGSEGSSTIRLGATTRQTIQF